jgi:hypothetical protein
MKNQKKPSKKVDFAFAGLNSRVHAIIPTSAGPNAILLRWLFYVYTKLLLVFKSITGSEFVKNYNL